MEPERLEQIRLFANLSAEDRADVAACMREVTVDAGTELTTQGDWAYELFVIETGEAEVRKDGEVVRKLGAGDAFGEIGLMATGTRTASVVEPRPCGSPRCSCASTRSFSTACPTSRSRCARSLPSAALTPGSDQPGESPAPAPTTSRARWR